MKKILALILALVILLCLTACGKDEESTPTSDSINDPTENTNDPTDGTGVSTQNPTEATTDNDPTESPTELPTEPPTEPPTTPPTTTPPTATPPATAPSTTTPPTTTETKECQHTNAFNVPNDDPSHPVPTCTADGYYLKYCPDCYKSWAEAVKALGHTGGTAKCTRKAVCSRCSNEYGEVDKNNHVGININRKEEAKEATCETEGYEGHIKYCSFCDTVVEYGKTIPALGHLLTPAPVYDKATDKIKAYCQRQGCNGGEYTDIEPLRIEMKGSLNIYGGCYPRAKCYFTPANGTRREIELDGGPASQDLTWCGYYWNYRCDKWSLGDKYEICAYDNSGRTATAIYEVVKTDSGYAFQKVG